MSERKSQQELDFERKHEEDLQRLRGLRLIDDDFMAAVFEERACAEFLLQIIINQPQSTQPLQIFFMFPFKIQLLL